MSIFPPTGAPRLGDIPGSDCGYNLVVSQATELINSWGARKFSHYLAPEGGEGVGHRFGLGLLPNPYLLNNLVFCIPGTSVSLANLAE